MDLLLPLGDPGIGLSDIEPRLYSGLSRISLGGAILTDLLNGVDYDLSGLPDGPGDLTLTYVHPPGAGFARRFGTPPSPTPQAIIIPLRESTADSLSVQVLKNGAPWSGGSPALTYLGTLSEPGDWAVSGWPDARPGEKWALRYSIGGVHGLETWEVPAVVESTLATYRRLDYAYIAGLFPESWTPADWVPFPATWLKIVPSGNAISPIPLPSPSGPPVTYAAWELVYTRLYEDLEDEQCPGREGRLRAGIFFQDGHRDGPIRLFFEAVALTIAAAPTGGRLGFSNQSAMPGPKRSTGTGFVYQELAFRFFGE